VTTARQYTDSGIENPFGREDLAELLPNRALHAHLRAGGSILTFPRNERDPGALAVILSRCLGGRTITVQKEAAE
jgi:hypothetical protein